MGKTRVFIGLNVCLFGGLNDWLVIGWLVGRFVGFDDRFVCWHIGLFLDCFVGGLLGWFIMGLLVSEFIG